jgi:hypothetical protein
MAALQCVVVQTCLWEKLRIHIRTHETDMLEHLKCINRHVGSPPLGSIIKHFFKSTAQISGHVKAFKIFQLFIRTWNLRFSRSCLRVVLSVMWRRVDADVSEHAAFIITVDKQKPGDTETVGLSKPLLYLHYISENSHHVRSTTYQTDALLLLPLSAKWNI